MGRSRASCLAVSVCRFDESLLPTANGQEAVSLSRTTCPPHWCASSEGVELLGGIGLILPAVTHILPWLTVAAAIGLALVMISAAIFHASRREFSIIGFNIVLLLLAAFVVIGRLTLAPF